MQCHTFELHGEKNFIFSEFVSFDIFIYYHKYLSCDTDLFNFDPRRVITLLTIRFSLNQGTTTYTRSMCPTCKTVFCETVSVRYFRIWSFSHSYIKSFFVSVIHHCAIWAVFIIKTTSAWKEIGMSWICQNIRMTLKKQ